MFLRNIIDQNMIDWIFLDPHSPFTIPQTQSYFWERWSPEGLEPRRGGKQWLKSLINFRY